MRKMWSFLLAALALTGCAAAPADALPAAETAEMTATETEETAAQPVGFTVGNLSEVPQHLRRLLGLEHRRRLL